MPRPPTSSKPAPTWRVSRHIFGPMTSGTSSWEGWPGSSMVALGRQTMSITWLMETSKTLRRFAVALLDLNARVRVGGLDDAEASLLPVVHGQVLERTEISTWRTDAGNLDVLSDIPDRDGRKLRYDDLVERADVVVIDGVAIPVASLEDVIGSKEGADRAKDREVLPELRAVAQSSNRG